VHQVPNWDVVEKVFAFNPHREQLLLSMRTWISLELQHVAAGLELVIGGSYLTTKPQPGDIDCTVLVPLAEASARGPALQLLSQDGSKGRIWQQYRVEAYPTLQVPGLNDFSVFFQYVGDKSALLHQCAAKDLRGVIKVTSWF
jgi:hypothetical protein